MAHGGGIARASIASAFSSPLVAMGEREEQHTALAHAQQNAWSNGQTSDRNHSLSI